MKSDREIYEERKARIAAENDCPPEEIQLASDVNPEGPQDKCDPVEPPADPIYLPPAIPPADPGDPDDLPPGIILSNAEVIVSCAVGEAVLSGEDPFAVSAGEVTSLFFIDSLAVIPAHELFRLALRHEEIQTFVDNNLRTSMGSGDSATYEAALISEFGVSAVVAQDIWAALIAESETLDLAATDIANAGLVCGWFNEPLLLECDSVAVSGYSVTVVEGEPVDLATDGSQVFIPAGIYQSEVSQADANTIAVNSYAGGLVCLVGNEEQVVTCVNVDAGFAASFDWYEGYNTSTYDDLTANVVTRTLSDLHGTTFYPAELAGSGTGRELIYTNTVAANQVFAATVEEANAAANAQAIAGLDCFFPSPATRVTCATPTYGSAAVASRLASEGYSETEMFKELSGLYYSNGSLIEETTEGPAYTEIEALPQYGVPPDTDTYSVGVPPGTFAANSYAASKDFADSYGASLLFCSWISPRHECFCSPSGATADGETINERNTVKFTDEQMSEGGARFRNDLSDAGNVLVRGTFISSTAPLEGTTLWPELKETCEAALVCIFDACRVAFCAPKHDDRDVNLVHLPNWNSWIPEFIGEPATQGGGHTSFLNEWYKQLDLSIAATTLSCPIGDYPDVYAACSNNPPETPGGDPFFTVGLGSPIGGTLGETISEATNDRAIADISDDGSGDGTIGNGYLTTGSPARFKYGGILKLNYVWGEPAVVDDPDGLGDNENPKPLTKPTIAPCTIASVTGQPTGPNPNTNEVGVQTPLPWGHFSGAEGYAVADTPVALGNSAMMDAISRLDCTHWNWARHFANCPQPNQTALRANFVLDAVMEASSTKEAHMAAEALILSEMACFTPSNFSLHQSGGKASMMAPSIAYVGGECAKRGAKELSLDALVNFDCSTPSSSISGGQLDLPLGASHIFVVLVCCPDESSEFGPVKKPALHIIGGDFDREDAYLANQSGEQGVDMQTVNAAIASLQDGNNNDVDAEREVWYIGSAWLGDSSVPDMIFVQAHTGPIVVGESCCEPAGDSIGRYTITKVPTPEGQTGDYITVAEGLVVEMNDLLDHGDPTVQRDPIRLHWPTLESVPLNEVGDSNPVTSVAVNNGDKIYVKVEVDVDGFITNTEIDVSDTEQKSNSPEAPTLAGLYFYKIGEIGQQVIGGETVMKITQELESDIFFTRPILSRNRFELYDLKQSDGGWTVKLADGVVYERNDALGGSATKLHWPKQGEGGTPLNQRLSKSLTVTNGETIYLKILADGDGFIKDTLIVQLTTEPVSTPGTGGADGEYFFEIGTISIAESEGISVGNINQKLSSDYTWQVGGSKYFAGNGIIITDDDEDTPLAGVVRLYESPDSDGLSAPGPGEDGGSGAVPTNDGLRGNEASLGFYIVDMCVNGLPGAARIYMTKPNQNSGSGVDVISDGAEDPEAGESQPPEQPPA